MDTLADKFLHNCFDVQIHTEDGIILTAHRIVIGAVSPFLHAVMAASSDSDSNASISFPGKTEELSLLLEFLYKGNIKVSFVKPW